MISPPIGSSTWNEPTGNQCDLGFNRWSRTGLTLETYEIVTKTWAAPELPLRFKQPVKTTERQG